MAFFKGSYYETLAPFDRDDQGNPPKFKGIRPRPIPAAEPVLEHNVTTGDRLDSVAQHFYANPRDWRRLADANPETLFAEDLFYNVATGDRPDQPFGARVLIPRRKEGRS
jgi:nucleoid-associated protein YgaU